MIEISISQFYKRQNNEKLGKPKLLFVDIVNIIFQCNWTKKRNYRRTQGCQNNDSGNEYYQLRKER